VRRIAGILALSVCAGGLSACGLVLGIDDVNGATAPDAGQHISGVAADSDAAVSGGTSGSSGSPGTSSAASGGASAANGGTAGRGGAGAPQAGQSGSAAGTDAVAGGSSGSAGSGGTRQPQAGTSAAGRGGEAGTSQAGAGSGGMGGTGGSAAGSGGGGAGTAAAGDDVHGKVIDYWAAAVGGAQVQIGDQMVSSNAQGEFSVPNVAATYDVSLVIKTMYLNREVTYVWRYEGLTRRDPTLQVYRGRPSHDGTLNIHVDNVDFANKPRGELARMDFAGPDGEFEYEASSVDTMFLDGAWSGPNQTSMVGHALLFQTSGDPALPSAYLAHDSKPFDLAEGHDGAITFDLAEGSSALPSATVSGTLTGPSGSNRNVKAYLRFADNAAIQLLTHYTTADTFSYLVPNLPNSTILLIGGQGDASQQYVFKDGVKPGQTGITLNFTDSPNLIVPAQNATNVDGSTRFQWSGGGTLALLVVTSQPRYDAMFVVTTKKETTLPVYPETSFALPAGEGYTWRIETHGTYASMDEATGSEGFLQSCAFYRPRGPKRGDGVYTESSGRDLTTKP
jgi:hypothetical protein